MKEKNLTLLIMAAGMGSRFGGLKQIEPVGPNYEFLIDYSIYDAIKAGFTKVVFIIKEENLTIFKETIGSRVEDKIQTEYVFQNIYDLPDNYYCPKERTKPWGTAHAILAAKNVIKEPFAIINADDFYGTDAYRKASEFLKQNEKEYAIIGYEVSKTLSENGAVKRGVCNTNGEYITELIESNIIEENGEITATPLDGSKPFKVLNNTYVSMNMMCFTPTIFNHIEENFVEFLDQNKNNLEKCEYLIPDLLKKITIEGKEKTKLIPTTAEWEGVTYKEDKEKVIKSIKEKIEKGEYPINLWND